MGRARDTRELHIAGVYGYGAERGRWVGGGEEDVGRAESDGEDGCAGGVDGGGGVALFTGGGLCEWRGFGGGWGAVLFLAGGRGE